MGLGQGIREGMMLGQALTAPLMQRLAGERASQQRLQAEEAKYQRDITREEEQERRQAEREKARAADLYKSLTGAGIMEEVPGLESVVRKETIPYIMKAQEAKQKRETDRALSQSIYQSLPESMRQQVDPNLPASQMMEVAKFLRPKQTEDLGLFEAKERIRAKFRPAEKPKGLQYKVDPYDTTRVLIIDPNTNQMRIERVPGTTEPKDNFVEPIEEPKKEGGGLLGMLAGFKPKPEAIREQSGKPKKDKAELMKALAQYRSMAEQY